MKRYLLDTSALLTLRDDEDGADFIADLLRKAQDGECLCFACFLSLMEILQGMERRKRTCWPVGLRGVSVFTY